MHKLAPVEEAKTLFEEAKDWGVWQWLMGKSRARQTADAAWEALDACEGKVRASWSEDLRKAWRRGGAKDVDPEIQQAVQRLKEADKEAYAARMAAEAKFDEADRRMSAGMACEGSQMAIDAWVMREKLIRKMEALGRGQ
jgi:hypothetical protein